MSSERIEPEREKTEPFLLSGKITGSDCDRRKGTERERQRARESERGRALKKPSQNFITFLSGLRGPEHLTVTRLDRSNQ